jgi:integrase
VLLLLDTGIRLSEAAGLSVHDVDLLEGRCRVMGKGAKERVVPVGRKARRAVRQMLARRGNPAASAPLFAGADGPWGSITQIRDCPDAGMLRSGFLTPARRGCVPVVAVTLLRRLGRRQGLRPAQRTGSQTRVSGSSVTAPTRAAGRPRWP